MYCRHAVYMHDNVYNFTYTHPPHMHTHMHTQPVVDKHTYTHVRMNAHTYKTNTHAHAHTSTHIHTHPHTLTITHLCDELEILRVVEIHCICSCFRPGAMLRTWPVRGGEGEEGVYSILYNHVIYIYLYYSSP